jgi:hypothetical protein
MMLLYGRFSLLMMPYGILLLKRQAISFMIAYLYSAPAAYDTPMLAAYAAIVVGSPDACVRKC